MAKAVKKKAGSNSAKKTPAKKSSKGKKKVVLATAGIALLGLLGFFGYKKWKQRKQQQTTAGKKSKNLFDLTVDTEVKPPPAPPKVDDPPPFRPAPPSPPPVKKKRTGKVVVHDPIVIDEQGKPVASDSFPLKSGSKGAKVRQLQEALKEKHPAAIPKGFKADVFGKMTAAVLKKSGYPATVDESTFNVIVQNVKPTEEKLAGQLYKYVIALDFNTVLQLLSAIQTPEQYSQTSKKFMNFYPLGSRPTLVTKLMTTFKEETQQQQLRQSFLRMTRAPKRIYRYNPVRCWANCLPYRMAMYCLATG
jgi:hypothetical protein